MTTTTDGKGAAAGEALTADEQRLVQEHMKRLEESGELGVLRNRMLAQLLLTRSDWWHALKLATSLKVQEKDSVADLTMDELTEALTKASRVPNKIEQDLLQHIRSRLVQQTSTDDKDASL